MPDIDDKKCPFCGRPNGCRAGDPACWCDFESVPADLRALVPPVLAMKACICLDCIRSWKADESAFRRDLETRRAAAP